MIDPRTLSDAELARYTRSIVGDIPPVWQEELLVRLERTIYPPALKTMPDVMREQQQLNLFS